MASICACIRDLTTSKGFTTKVANKEPKIAEKILNEVGVLRAESSPIQTGVTLVSKTNYFIPQTQTTWEEESVVFLIVEAQTR